MPDFDVIDFDAADSPERGETAPDFTRPLVTDEFWEDRSLSDVVADEGRTILVFTSMIGAYTSKYVWDELAERDWFDRADRIVGLSAATPYAISAFLDDNDHPFAVFADPANDVAGEYGIVHDLDGMEGISEPRMAVFVLEPDLTVADAWVADEWPEFPPYDDLEERFGLEA
ncbi:redoxin domain-containing protein [Natronolimnohabitans innermongolicus]|uniref:Alkyl hydroperoxide reductase/ thiol specific antioxidant/ Mal allergen n=1 Tax=Natronolimnohabitans innermongolicus JCM 12255 TaxID=1227499 RepID=L9X209_9EURY|nr:redoxin domain-containing protein [Natronolimnohabitans innermongolicus]ELY55642.1 alkyl hydroperoxide reductase/ thiol specific antioxidant/ Mal allergen [Natronolimnohabitans innermongolicus JCM 12255]